MYCVTIILAPSGKNVRSSEYADYVVDSYPTGDWLFDSKATGNDESKFVFYAHDPEDVRKMFSETCSDFGLKIGSLDAKLVTEPEMEKVRERLDE